MLYRTLGRTGLRVSLVGLGTGGPSRLGQSAGHSAAESQRVVRTALELGINLFDTAPGYGESEALLGEALRGVPREHYVLATKFEPHEGGRVKTDTEALTRQLDESLRRLQVEAVDVLQYHGVSPQMYHEVLERFHPVALRAQQAGKVRFLGITETVARDPEHQMLARALEDGLFDTIMVKYGILNQGAAAQVLPLAEHHNVGVLVMAPVRTSLRGPAEAVRTLEAFIAQGLLKLPPPQLHDPLGLGRVGEPTAEVTRIAYQFAAQPAAVSSVLVGTGQVEHLRQNVADVLAPSLSEAQFAYLRRTYGHLRSDA